jgi:predicted LPLAT superfamily acyltransferase
MKLEENDSAAGPPVISDRKLYPIVVAFPLLHGQARIIARVEVLRRLCAELHQRRTANRATQGHLAELANFV